MQGTALEPRFRVISNRSPEILKGILKEEGRNLVRIVPERRTRSLDESPKVSLQLIKF